MKSNIYILKLMLLSGLCFFFSSCQDQLDDVQPNTTLTETAVNDASGSGMMVTEIQFTATAMITSCYGENIMFTGTIENRVKKTRSASGQTHFIRQFTVKGMTGTGLTSGTMFDVVGGAEMFNIKDTVYNMDGSLNLPASLSESDIVIHRGTLVFVSREDGSRVVARHIITKNPGRGVMTNTWDCGGK